MAPTCLHLHTDACILLFALRLIRGLVAWGTWPRQVGVRSQVATGDQRAHVDVVRKDIVANELTKEKDQVGKFYSLAFISRLRFKRKKKIGFKIFNICIPLQKLLK